RDVKRAFELNGKGNVVQRQTRLQLFEKPHSFLVKGGGEGFSAAAGLRRDGDYLVLLPGRHDFLRKARDRGSIKQIVEWQARLEDISQPGHDLGGLQRMSSQLKKVVIDPDRGSIQHLAPSPGHHFLDPVARGDKVRI